MCNNNEVYLGTLESRVQQFQANPEVERARGFPDHRQWPREYARKKWFCWAHKYFYWANKINCYRRKYKLLVVPTKLHICCASKVFLESHPSSEYRLSRFVQPPAVVAPSAGSAPVIAAGEVSSQYLSSILPLYALHVWKTLSSASLALKISFNSSRTKVTQLKHPGHSGNEKKSSIQKARKSRERRGRKESQGSLKRRPVDSRERAPSRSHRGLARNWISVGGAIVLSGRVSSGREDGSALIDQHRMRASERERETNVLLLFATRMDSLGPAELESIRARTGTGSPWPLANLPLGSFSLALLRTIVAAFFEHSCWAWKRIRFLITCACARMLISI